MKDVKIDQLLVKDVMSSSAVTAKKGETLSEVISRMKKSQIREIPVLEGDRPVGLVSYSSLLLRRSVPLSSKVEQVMRPAPRLEEEMPIAQAVEELMASGVRGAPVVRNNKMVGFISRTDVIRILPNVSQLKDKKVSAFMSKNPQAVYDKESVHRAEILMRGLMEKSLPVVDVNGRLVGAVSMHEILEILWNPKATKPSNVIIGERAPPEIMVGSIMNRPALSVSPDDTIGDVANMMIQRKLTTVFVQENGRLVGVVSQADLMEQVISLKQKEGVYVQITGLDQEDPDIYTILYEQIEKSMRRIDKIQFPRVFTVHVSTYHPEGLRSKYSIHARLTTDKGMYYANETDWDLYRTMDRLLQQLEKNVKREHERQLDMRKKKRSGPL